MYRQLRPNELGGFLGGIMVTQYVDPLQEVSAQMSWRARAAVFFLTSFSAGGLLRARPTGLEVAVFAVLLR